MMYERMYMEALVNGDEITQRAIERLNRNDYSCSTEGIAQETRDRIRATFGDAYRGNSFYEDHYGISRN